MFFRKVEESDRPMLSEWLALDEAHRDLFKPEWWITEQTKATATYCIEDDKGPIMFVRQDAEGMDLRLYVQFPPSTEKMRIARALKECIEPVKGLAKARGFESIIFDSRSESLGAFMVRLGFEPEYRYRLKESK